MRRVSVSTDITMDDVQVSVEETEESAARKNSETAAALFGHMDHVSSFQTSFASSPLLKPTVAMSVEMPPPVFRAGGTKGQLADADAYADADANANAEWGWPEMRSPENIELDELDDLLGEY